MDQALQDLMRREVARQSRYALIAAEEVQRWLHYESESDDPSYEDAQDRLWANVQSFMGSAAMVSKLLWVLVAPTMLIGGPCERLLA